MRPQSQRLFELALCLREVAGADEEFGQLIVGSVVGRVVPDRAPEAQLIAGPVLHRADEG